MVNWNSIYGVGQGGAHVWQGNKGLDYLEKQNFLEQQQRQKQADELGKDLAKINTEGAKREDLPELTNKLKAIKQTFAEMRGARNNDERLKIQAKYDDLKADFGNALYSSKEEVKSEAELHKIGLTKPNEVSDTFYNDLKAWRSMSTFDPRKKELGEKLQQTMYRNKFDDLKFTKEIAPMVADEVNGADSSRRVGNATVYSRKVGQQANPEKLRQVVFGQLNGGNRELAKFLQERYQGVPLAQAVEAYVQDKTGELNSIYQVKDQTVRTEEDEKPDRFYEHEMWKKKMGIGEWGKANPTPPVVGPKVFKTSKGRPAITFNRYAPINPVKITLPQIAQAYDVSTGQNVTNITFDGATITGVGDAVIKGGKVQQKVSIVDKDGFDYIINMRDIPLDTKNNKDMQVGLQALGGENQRTRPQQQKSRTQSQTGSNQQNRPAKTPTFKGVPKGGF